MIANVVVAALAAFMIGRAFAWARKIAAWPPDVRRRPYWPLACALAFIEAAAGLGFLFLVVQLSR